MLRRRDMGELADKLDKCRRSICLSRNSRMKKEMNTQREDEDGDTETKKGVSIVFKPSNPNQSNLQQGIQQAAAMGYIDEKER